MADSSEQKPQLCIGGCGFFGHPSFGNYCSVCFKQGKAPTSAAAAVAAAPAATLSVSPTTPPAAVATPEVAPAAAASDSSTSAAPARPVQKNIQKCWQCNKRVGLLGFKCKCDYVFCSNHRLSHAHNCIVDYQTLARGELETRLGDAVVPKKLERL